MKRNTESVILKTEFYNKICESLAKKANQKKLFTYIAEYRNRYIDIVSSPLIVKLLPFRHDGDDANIVFECCGVERDNVEKFIKTALKEVALDQAGKNITAFNVVMVMAMSYFFDDQNKLTMLYMYYAYSFYFSVFTRQFKKFLPDESTMMYTLDNMNNKFTLKKQGSLDGALKASMSVAIKCYPDKFKSLSDMDIINIINAFKTRVGHMIKNIFNEYNKNYIKGDRIFTTVEKNSEGETIEREGNIGTVANLATKYTTRFFSTGVNIDSVKFCAKLCTISENELRTAVTLIIKDEKIADVKQFYESIFFLFFETIKDASEADIKTTRFLAAADAIYKKGNSNDVNIKNIKDISHKWLATGSNTYRCSHSPSTVNNFRKAIYLYFVSIVVNS